VWLGNKGGLTQEGPDTADTFCADFLGKTDGVEKITIIMDATPICKLIKK
jgi:hypothetical protein